MNAQGIFGNQDKRSFASKNDDDEGSKSDQQLFDEQKDNKKAKSGKKAKTSVEAKSESDGLEAEASAPKKKRRTKAEIAAAKLE